MTLRLLPWAGEGGKACFLSSDDGSSFLARLANYCEDVQLGMAEDLLEHVRETVAAGPLSEAVLLHLVSCLSASLRDVLRVAESRGGRLPARDERDGADELSRAARAVAERTVNPSSAAFGWGVPR